MDVGNNKYSSFYESYMKDLQEKAQEAVKDAQKKAFSEYFDVAAKKIRTMYEDVINDFYNDYPDSFYEKHKGRRGSLYNLIQTKKTSEYLSIWFDPSLISYRNGYAEENGLYTTTFRQGWHGGANKYGGMKYPVGRFEKDEVVRYYDGEYKPYDDIRYLWIPAKQAPISPLQDIKNRIDQYQEEEYQEDYNKIWNKHKSNIKIK